MRLSRLSNFDGEAVLSLADAKAHLRVLHAEEDALIGALRDAAVQYVERASGIVLAPAEFRWEAPGFARADYFPVRPVTELLSVSYTDGAGDPVDYEGAVVVMERLRPAPGMAWPVAGTVSIEFVAGDDMVPPDLQVAVKLMLAHLFENRSAVTTGPTPTELPMAVNALIDQHRWIMI
ncbi:head-tail connector protein [Qipengyuania sp.]|uniref:head-tail connector protein n=1 Tax=Qipengyuania sp. TaxID=2004515 RepID=UPI0035C86160